MKIISQRREQAVSHTSACASLRLRRKGEWWRQVWRPAKMPPDRRAGEAFGGDLMRQWPTPAK